MRKTRKGKCRMSKMKKVIAGVVSGAGTFFILVAAVGAFAALVRRVSPMLKIVK